MMPIKFIKYKGDNKLRSFGPGKGWVWIDDIRPDKEQEKLANLIWFSHLTALLVGAALGALVTFLLIGE